MFDDDDDCSVLEVLLGTKSPCWRLGSDSNALELAAVRGLTNIGVALTAEQAANIRNLTGVTSHIRLDVSLFGNAVSLHLVGKKINMTHWAGTASSDSDTLSVAEALSTGLASAACTSKKMAPVRRTARSTSDKASIAISLPRTLEQERRTGSHSVPAALL